MKNNKIQRGIVLLFKSEMKSNTFLLGFLILSIFAISTMTAVSADTYSIGVKVGDSYTWELRTLDPRYPVPPTVKQGDKAQMTITNIVESASGWTVDYTYWDFGEDFSGTGTSSSGDIPQDPYHWEFEHICGLPVHAYLTTHFGEFGQYFVSGNKITIAWGDYKWEIAYDTSTGVLSSKTLYENSVIVYEVALVTAIPGYELPILLGVSAVSTIGLIYLVMKKK